MLHRYVLQIKAPPLKATTTLTVPRLAAVTKMGVFKQICLKVLIRSQGSDVGLRGFPEPRRAESKGRCANFGILCIDFKAC